jgi:hypothetical protein
MPQKSLKTFIEIDLTSVIFANIKLYFKSGYFKSQKMNLVIFYKSKKNSSEVFLKKVDLD